MELLKAFRVHRHRVSSGRKAWNHIRSVATAFCRGCMAGVARHHDRGAGDGCAGRIGYQALQGTRGALRHQADGAKKDGDGKGYGSRQLGQGARFHPVSGQDSAPHGVENHCAASPAGASRLQGGNIIAWPPLGEACKMGSTPATRVITVALPETVPSVETIITASPFWTSERDAGG